MVPERCPASPWGGARTLRPRIAATWRIATMIAVLCAGLLPAVARAADPVASNASYTATPGGSLAITLSATDGDSDPLTFIITSLPTKATLAAGSTTLSSTDLPYSIPANGKSVTYTANSTAHGTDTFQFKANDGGADSNTATVTVLVNQAPTEVSTTFFTEPNTDLKVTLPAEDADSDALTYTLTSLPGHGTLKSGSTTLTDETIPLETTTADVTYTPDTDYHGADSFTFTATDGYATTASITAAIEVNTTPVPDTITTTVLPNGTATIQLTSTDADKDPVLYEIASLPAHGTLAAIAGTLTGSSLPVTLGVDETTVVYTVASGYQGTDSFHFRVQDSVSVSSRAVVSIAVNMPPIVADASLTAAMNETVAGTLAAADLDGDALTVRISQLPTAGTLKVDNKSASSTTTTYQLSGGSLPFTYTPVTGAVGVVSFQWVANDGKEDSDPAVVSITFTDPDAQETTTPPADETPDTTETPTEDDSTGALNDWTGDDEVLADEPPAENVAAPCGVAGTVETLALALVLLATPGRFFRRKPAPRPRYPLYK